MNEFIERYCRATGMEPGEILNKKKDRESVTRRNAFIYLTWLHRKSTVSLSLSKSRVMLSIALEFDMRRNSIFESVAKFEEELELYRCVRELFEDIRQKSKSPD